MEHFNFEMLAAHIRAADGARSGNPRETPL